MSAQPTFDFQEFMAAVEVARRERNMRWVELADVVWQQSGELNAQRNDHPL